MAKSTFIAPKQEAAPVPIPTPPLKVMPPRYSDIGSEGCAAQIQNQREWDQLPVGAYFYDCDGTLKQRNAKPTDLLDGVRGSKLHPYNIETDEEFAQLKPGDWYLDCRPPYVPPAGIGLGGKHNPYDVWDDEYFKRIPRGAWYIDDRPGHRNKNTWEPKQKDSD
jgi:hypothetical protein